MGTDSRGHRAGALKQTNKAHKTGRHRSKGAIDNEQKGKISLKTITKRQKNLASRDHRRNTAKNIRKHKRDEVFARKRSLGGQETAPYLVCLLPLHVDIDPRSALSIFEACDPEAIVHRSTSGVTHIK